MRGIGAWLGVDRRGARRFFPRAWAVAVILWGAALLPMSGLLLAQADRPADSPAAADAPAAGDAALSNRFVYQGRLQEGATPLAGPCDLRFRLYDAANAGSQVGSQQLINAVALDQGLFAVTLNAGNEFGATAFRGERRWLEVAVRCPAGSGGFTTLSPRQELTAAPYALYAPHAGSVPWDGVTGVPANVANPPTYSAGTGLQLSDGVFSVLFAGSGAAGSAARSDHTHFGQVWQGNHAVAGLTLTNTNTTVPAQTLHVAGAGQQVLVAVNNAPGSNINYGVVGIVNSARGAGVRGEGTATGDNNVYGVLGTSYSTTGAGVRGVGITTSGDNRGVHGHTNSTTGTGVYGTATSQSTGLNYGVRGVSISSNGRGVDGRATAATGSGVGVFGSATAATGWAGLFSGRVQVLGDFAATTKTFVIDHPLDPENKYLVHSSVESSERLNLYTGNVTLDAQGEATVRVPAWFAALNTDIRYQLTAIGAPGPNLHIAQKLADGQFRIAGGGAGMEVSWQLSGVRHDPAALAQPLVVEPEKPAAERGSYLMPTAHGQAATRGLGYRLTEDQDADTAADRAPLLDELPLR